MSESRLILSAAHAAQSGDWADRLAQIARACGTAFARDEARHLRALDAALRDAPCPDTIAGVTIPDAARLEGLINAGACEAGAITLLDETCGYMLSRGNSGDHIASVILPGQTGESTACGDSLTLALVGAIAQALALMPLKAQNFADGASRPALRLH